jgi:uncharacterized protein YbjT (DUF2867 family)
MYLITGAGGGVGGVSRRVVELLLDDGEHVRAMVRRDDERADQLTALGAEVRLSRSSWNLRWRSLT